MHRGQRRLGRRRATARPRSRRRRSAAAPGSRPPPRRPPAPSPVPRARPAAGSAELDQHVDRPRRAGAPQRLGHQLDAALGVDPAGELEVRVAVELAGQPAQRGRVDAAGSPAGSGSPRTPGRSAAGCALAAVMPHAPCSNCRCEQLRRHRRLAVRRVCDAVLAHQLGHRGEVVRRARPRRARRAGRGTRRRTGSSRGPATSPMVEPDMASRQPLEPPVDPLVAERVDCGRSSRPGVIAIIHHASLRMLQRLLRDVMQRCVAFASPPVNGHSGGGDAVGSRRRALPRRDDGAVRAGRAGSAGRGAHVDPDHRRRRVQCGLPPGRASACGRRG